MPEKTPEVPDINQAVSQLFRTLTAKGSNASMWLMLVITTVVAPIAAYQVNQNRGPGSHEYLNQLDFEIIGPERAVVGELVRLSVINYKPGIVQWESNGDIEPYGLAESQCVMTAKRPGPVEIICAITRNRELYLTKKIIEFDAEPVATTPEPTPKPTPKPKPKPEPGPALSTFATAVIDWCGKYNLSADVAGGMSINFHEAAGDNEDVRSLLKDTGGRNDSLDIPEGLKDTLKAELQARAGDGKLVSMQDHKDLWEQLSKAFYTYALDNGWEPPVK